MRDPASDPVGAVSDPLPAPGDPGLAGRRFDYTVATLDPVDLGDDPVAAFERWLGEALAVSPSELEAHAFALATATPDGRPSVRTLLLKGVEGGAFVFFTNYGSRKGIELAANPHVAMNFRWPELQRQVVVLGQARRVRPEESDAYFDSRPLESRIGAHASRQSAVIADRSVLDDAVARIAAAGEPIRRPQNWGGFRVVPEEIEFWQGRPSRLHDRIRFRRPPGSGLAGGWIRERLSP